MVKLLVRLRERSRQYYSSEDLVLALYTIGSLQNTVEELMCILDEENKSRLPDNSENDNSGS